MARDLEQLVLSLSADIRKLERNMNDGQRKFDKQARAIEKRAKELDKKLAELGATAGEGLSRLSLVAGVAFGAISGYAIRAASDAGEIQNAFEVAFGASAKQAQAFAEQLAGNVGRSVTDVQSSMSRLQLVLTGMGLAGDEALKITQALSERAIDLGSLWNVQDAEAFASVISAITGESEPMKKFGAVINETAVKAELLRLGFKGNAEQASDAAKAIARANLVLAKTASANGDAARTAESAANQFKRAKAEFHDAAVTLGRELLPAATQATKAAADLAEEFGNLSPAVQLGGLALLGLVAASGPIAAAIAGLAKLIKTAQAARVAMAGIAGTSAITGLGAGAALGAGATAGGVVIGGAAIGASTINASKFRSTVAAPTKASDASLAQALNFAQKNAENLERQGGRGRGPELLAGFQRDMAKIQAEQKRRADSETAQLLKGADQAAAAALKGFGLSGQQTTPAGPAKTSGAGRAAREADQAARLANQQTDRFNAELARAQDRELAVRALINSSIEDRARAELDRIAVEAKAREEDLRLAVVKKELRPEQAKQIAAAEALTRSAEETAILARKEEDLREERLSQEQTLASLAVELVGLQIGAARTARERRSLEEKLLKLQQDAARVALESGLASNPNLSAADKDAQRRGLSDVQAAEREALRQQSLTPLERIVDQTPRALDEVTEAFERMAADGLGSLEDSLVQAALRAEDLGDVAKSVFRQIAADLLTMVIRQNITSPLAGIFKAAIPGFAKGTNFAPGGLAYVHKDELINLPRGSQVMPAHITKALKPTAPGSSAPPVVNLDLRGAVIWEQEAQKLMAYADQTAGRAGVMATQASRRMTMSDFQRRARTSL